MCDRVFVVRLRLCYAAMACRVPPLYFAIYCGDYSLSLPYFPSAPYYSINVPRKSVLTPVQCYKKLRCPFQTQSQQTTSRCRQSAVSGRDALSACVKQTCCVEVLASSAAVLRLPLSDRVSSRRGSRSFGIITTVKQQQAKHSTTDVSTLVVVESLLRWARVYSLDHRKSRGAAK